MRQNGPLFLSLDRVLQILGDLFSARARRRGSNRTDTRLVLFWTSAKRRKNPHIGKRGRCMHHVPCSRRRPPSQVPRGGKEGRRERETTRWKHRGRGIFVRTGKIADPSLSPLSPVQYFRAAAGPTTRDTTASRSILASRIVPIEPHTGVPTKKKTHTHTHPRQLPGGRQETRWKGTL